ncbi:MAG: rhodanese domain protein [Ilumatobacteraceae bacterium]|nr:rhodanese domain protein [Ilumatobacteraceae bacterium]
MAISEISIDELADQLGSIDGTSARLIDVREVDEYESGHVPGARLVVLGTVPDNVDAFSGDGPTYVICKSGGRSMRACEFLSGEGLDVVNVTGGTMAWTMSGRPVVEGDLPT